MQITCQTELDRVAQPGPGRDECLLEFGEEQVGKLEQTYQNKIQMTLRGDRSYVMTTGVKSGVDVMALKTAVQESYLKVYKSGQIIGCDGNVSARLAPGSEEFLCTPTGIYPEDIKPSDVVICDKNGETTGPIKPTSEVNLHSRIYAARPDVGAIVHAHSIYACALAGCRIPLPPTHYAVCELLCHPISNPEIASKEEEMVVKCGDYATYGTMDLAETTLEALGAHNACFMANHGSVVVGKDLAHAMHNQERLERECEIYWRARQLGEPVSLTLEEIKSLALRDESYGQDA